MSTSYRGCSLTFADIGDQLWVDDLQGWFFHNTRLNEKCFVRLCPFGEFRGLTKYRANSREPPLRAGRLFRRRNSFSTGAASGERIVSASELLD